MGRKNATATKEQLLAAGVQHRTLKEVGRDFGVSRERIRQLVVIYDIERLDRRNFSWECDDLAASHSQTQQKYAPRSSWPRGGYGRLRRRLGLCLQHGCLELPSTGHKICQGHLDQMNKRARARNHWRKEHGLCIHCAKRALEGHTLCLTHLRALRAASAERNKRLRKERGQLAQATRG